MKILAYITYLAIGVAGMFILHSAGVGDNLWQFWAIELGYVGTCACGMILGWKE